MPFATSLSRPDWRLSEDARRRAVGLFAVALIHLAFAALLLSLAPPIVRLKMAEMVMFSVDTPSDKPKAPEEAKPEAKASPAKTVAPTPRPEVRQPPVQPTSAIERPETVIPLESPPAAPEVAPAQQKPAAPVGPMFGPPAPRRSTDSGADTPRVEGSGPNGEPLYAAAWYREPYDDELKGYLSTAHGPGWGLIACRTAPDYRVEDCIIIGEYPNGSGIARAVQAAAWQFKVRPPRIAGRYQVGEWVQIRIDYGINPRRR